MDPEKKRFEVWTLFSLLNIRHPKKFQPFSRWLSEVFHSTSTMTMGERSKTWVGPPSQDASGKWRFSSGSPSLKYSVNLVVTSQHPGPGDNPIYNLYITSYNSQDPRIPSCHKSCVFHPVFSTEKSTKLTNGNVACSLFAIVIHAKF